MPVHLHLPGPPLYLFVENFWSVMQHPSAWTKERILPDGGLEMIFNLGEPQRLHDRNGNGPGTVFRNCWFSGPRTRSIVLTHPSTDNTTVTTYEQEGKKTEMRQAATAVPPARLRLDYWDVAYDGKPSPSSRSTSRSVALNVPIEPRMFPDAKQA